MSDWGFDSVWEGNDHEFLLLAIPAYLRISGTAPIRILDTTFGNGVFWKGAQRGWADPEMRYRVVGLDWDPTKPAELLANNHNLPFLDSTFDCVVHDPPHVSHEWSYWDQSPQYSIENGSVGDGSISHAYPGFLQDAARVLRKDGIVVCKLADQVHSGRSFFQVADFVRMVSGYGLTPCDVIVKVRKSPRPQPKGRRQLHARRRHSFYVIARKGGC